MREYRVVEDQDEAKRPKQKFHGVRKVSPHKQREVEKQKPDTAKLGVEEIPYNLLLKIDKMVLKQLKNYISPDFLKAFAKENNIIIRSMSSTTMNNHKDDDHPSNLHQHHQSLQNKIQLQPTNPSTSAFNQDPAADNPSEIPGYAQESSNTNALQTFPHTLPTTTMEIDLDEYE